MREELVAIGGYLQNPQTSAGFIKAWNSIYMPSISGHQTDYPSPEATASHLKFKGHPVNLD